MKCGRPSPYGEFDCQLDKGHEGQCFDGMHNFIEQLTRAGRDLIFDVNAKFNVSIPVTEETTKTMFDLVDGTEFGYCPDCDKPDCDNCDERRGEPMRDESRD